MENDILDSLNDLGYEGPLVDENVFSKAIDVGPKSLEYTKLVHILAEELKKHCNLEETVNMMNDPDDSSSFLLELSSFLKELGCPYKKLTTGHMSSRLQTREERLLLLDYMISELMAARMVQVDCPKEKPAGMEIIVQESPTARYLKEILVSLKFNKPPPNITLEMLFSKLEAKLKETIQKEGDNLVGKPLYNKAITDKDWKNLEASFSEMYEEYRLRRETLITRLECTIQSFEWSDRLKNKKDQIQTVYRPKKEHLKPKPDVGLSDFLAARTTLLHVEKTSSASVRKNTQSQVNKVIIGSVPDRGGRPNEQQPPPPEMPSWQQRSAPQSSGFGQSRGGGGVGGGRGGDGGRGGRGGDRGGGRGGDRGGRGGRGGGGRVQGGYAQGQGDQRPQPSPVFNQNRNYQTYEVPPGGYNQQGHSQNNGSGSGGYNQNAGSYNQNQGYSQNQGYGGAGYNQDESEKTINQEEQNNEEQTNEKEALVREERKEREALNPAVDIEKNQNSEPKNTKKNLNENTTFHTTHMSTHQSLVNTDPHEECKYLDIRIDNEGKSQGREPNNTKKNLNEDTISMDISKFESLIDIHTNKASEALDVVVHNETKSQNLEPNNTKENFNEDSISTDLSTSKTLIDEHTNEECESSDIMIDNVAIDIMEDNESNNQNPDINNPKNILNECNLSTDMPICESLIDKRRSKESLDLVAIPVSSNSETESQNPELSDDKLNTSESLSNVNPNKSDALQVSNPNEVTCQNPKPNNTKETFNEGDRISPHMSACESVINKNPNKESEAVDKAIDNEGKSSNSESNYTRINLHDDTTPIDTLPCESLIDKNQNEDADWFDIFSSDESSIYIYDDRLDNSFDDDAIIDLLSFADPDFEKSCKVEVTETKLDCSNSSLNEKTTSNTCNVVEKHNVDIEDSEDKRKKRKREPAQSCKKRPRTETNQTSSKSNIAGPSSEQLQDDINVVIDFISPITETIPGTPNLQTTSNIKIARPQKPNIVEHLYNNLIYNESNMYAARKAAKAEKLKTKRLNVSKTHPAPEPLEKQTVKRKLCDILAERIREKFPKKKGKAYKRAKTKLNRAKHLEERLALNDETLDESYKAIDISDEEIECSKVVNPLGTECDAEADKRIKIEKPEDTKSIDSYKAIIVSDEENDSKEVNLLCTVRNAEANTKHDTIQEPEEAERVYRFAAFAEKHPAVQIQQEQCVAFQKIFWERLEATPDPIPIVNMRSLINGRIPLTCKGEHSVQWLYKFNGLRVEDIKIKIVDVDRRRPRRVKKEKLTVKMAWKSRNISVLDTTRVLNMMERFHPRLKTDCWKIIDVEVNEEKLNVRRIVLMDKASLEYIREKEFRLDSGIDQSLFKLLAETRR